MGDSLPSVISTSTARRKRKGIKEFIHLVHCGSYMMVKRGVPGVVLEAVTKVN